MNHHLHEEVDLVEARLSATQRAVLARVALHGWYVHLSGDGMEVPRGARAFPKLVKLGYLTIAKSSVSRTPGEASINVFGKQWRPGSTNRETKYEITDKGRDALESDLAVLEDVVVDVGGFVGEAEDEVVDPVVDGDTEGGGFF